VVVRRAVLVLCGLALVVSALPADAAKPTVLKRSSGTVLANWVNNAPGSEEFSFEGTFSFGRETYSGGAYYNSRFDRGLHLGSWDGPTVATCTVTHTPGINDDSGLEPDNNASPAAGVIRCTGHLSVGADSTTTLVMALTDGVYWGRQYSRFFYRGTYTG
jgi:hypothetical protein